MGDYIYTFMYIFKYLRLQIKPLYFDARLRLPFLTLFIHAYPYLSMPLILANIRSLLTINVPDDKEHFSKIESCG